MLFRLTSMAYGSGKRAASSSLKEGIQALCDAYDAGQDLLPQDERSERLWAGARQASLTCSQA